jgi:predicted DNA-binding protein
MTEFKPFLVRLSPTNVELLDNAKKDLEKSKSSIINDAIKAYLSGNHRDINARLNKIV